MLGPNDFPLELEEDFDEEHFKLGPVRMAGWYGGKTDPLLHAKLAVCCETWVGEDEFGVERSGISARQAWIGSANWTKSSPKHAEVGVWIDDAEFANAALEFVVDLIRRSERFPSQEPVPTLELAEAELDDDAFADYAAQFGMMDDSDDDGHLDDEA